MDPDILKALAVDEDLDEDDVALIAVHFEKKDRRFFYQVFDLNTIPATDCEEYFRFSAPEIRQLCQMLGMPNIMEASNGYQGHGTKASGLEVLCIVLRRLAYPCRYTDLTLLFHRPKYEICLLFNLGLDHIYHHFNRRLTDMNQPWLAVPQLLQYSEVLRAKGCRLRYCWGMVDGTVRKMCRPTQHQREVYNGHHRVHALKFQSIVTPNGLIANLFGPMEGRRHDSALLNASGVLDYMQQHMTSPDGQPMCIYGDPAYPLTPHMQRPYRGQHLAQQQQAFNTAMSSVRQCVAWEYGKVVKLWAFLDFEKNLKLFLFPVGKLYMVGVLLTNCHTCLHGSETSQYFQLNPPNLQDYLY